MIEPTRTHQRNVFLNLLFPILQQSVLTTLYPISKLPAHLSNQAAKVLIL